VSAWTRARHEVTVIAPLPNRPQGVRYAGFRRRLWTVRPVGDARCIRVWSWLIGKKRRPWARILENATYGVNSALALLTARRPDVVIVESWPVLATAAVVVVCSALGIRVINYVQDIYPETAVAAGLLRSRRLTALLRSIDRWICQRADCNIVISDGASALLTATRGLPADNVRIIPNWLDLTSIGPTQGGPAWREAHGLPPDKIVIMFAGTMGYVSRIDILVDVAEELRAQQNICLVCVGHGPLKPRMEAEIRRRGLQNLLLLPFQPREQVADMQSAADIMLLTTSAQAGSSSVPSKLITYLAMGKPIICAVPTDTDIARLVQQEGLGCVVPPENPSALANAIAQMATTPRADLLAMGHRARAIALARHSLESALSNFNRLFADMRLSSAH